MAEPTIIRVRNLREAQTDARRSGLTPKDYKYIEREEHAMSMTIKPGLTYYVHQDVPQELIESRVR